jgi:hypothetical protein
MATATTPGDRATDTAAAVTGTVRQVTQGYSRTARRVRETPTHRVPEVAKGRQVGAEGYVLDELGDGVFWLSDGSYQSMFVVGDEGVIAVDAPPTQGLPVPRGFAGG